MFDDIVPLEYVQRAIKGNLQPLGESICVMHDDLGLSLDQIVFECTFASLSRDIAEQALAVGRAKRAGRCLSGM